MIMSLPFPLEFNLVDDASSTDQKEAFDRRLTSFPFVAPFVPSTPIGITVIHSTLLTSPILLLQCTGLEMGEPFRGDASIIGDVRLLGRKNLPGLSHIFRRLLIRS